MKTLRYVLTVIGILSVMSVTAATYGTMHQPQKRGNQYAQINNQMPTATMSSTGSTMMNSGSTLPMAAASGTTTANDYAPSGAHRPKRSVDSDDEEITPPEDNGEPDPTPVGDAVLPLLLCALAFCGVVYLRKRKAQA